MRLDSGETDLQVEGAIAKLFATEIGNACADAAIQALGGYGYIREYDVEKIKRDVKITTIYEGTSEIQQLIISTFRWRSSVQSKDEFYEYAGRSRWTPSHADHPDLKADVFAGLVRLAQPAHRRGPQGQGHPPAVRDVPAGHPGHRRRDRRRPRQEGRRGATAARPRAPSTSRLCARVNTALAAQTAFAVANEILYGTGQVGRRGGRRPSSTPSGFDYAASQSGLILDMDAPARPQVAEGAFK